MEKRKIQWEQTDKQGEAWDFLLDKLTEELLFGGGAGGGKTLLMCGFSVYMVLRYKDIRGFLGRNSLEDFKKSTMLTLYDVMKNWGLKEKRDFSHNQQDKYFHFLQTGSRIYYNELSYYPTDPNYDYLGSTEYTFACIDEANQVREKAKSVLRSRIRYKLAQNGLKPKLLLSCNPDKGYLYTQFYKPWKNQTLSVERRFVQALAKDNQFVDPSYIKTLQSLDIVTKERLLFGNWEYDDDPATLCEYDAILDMFSNILKEEKPQKYIVADIARFGDDKTVFGYFEGWACKKISMYAKLSTTEVSEKMREWREHYAVPLSHVLVDEDGVGGGVKDQLGCRGFMGGRSPFKNENYRNLKTQCSYYLAKKINAREVSVFTENEELKNQLIEELEQIKAKDRDKDGKLKIMDKEEVKEHIGHSPDIADMLMMRSYFDLVPKPSIVFL